MTRKLATRRGVRLSRPDQDRFFTVMVVFSQRTFRWSMARRTLMWTVGVIAGVSTLAMIGSAYGLWATKKIMNFSALQQETASQQRQLKDSLHQAQGLEGEVENLRTQLNELLQAINPKQEPTLPPPPGVGGRPGGPSPAPEAQGAPAKESPSQPAKEDPKVGRLRSELERAVAQAKLLRTHMDPIVQRWNHTPSVPPTAGYLSSGFGLRISPFSRANEVGDGLLRYHPGIDISNAEGTPIQATADGEVLKAGWGGDYGWMVVLRHSDRLETLYGHMSRLDVKVGQRVSRGDILGAMGRSGNATGTHLHYEVHQDNHTVNPMPYMRLQKQWLSTLK